MKQKEWMVVLGILAIVAFLWLSGGFRELFSGSNPVLSQADVDSTKMTNGVYTGTPTTNALTAMNWAKTNIPWPANTSDTQKQEILGFNIAMLYQIVGDKFASFISSLPSSVTPDTVVPQFYTWLKANTSFSGNQDFVPTVIGLIKKGQPPVNTIDDVNFFYWLYVYLFGVPSSSSTPSSPAPAASSSTQPMTVGVPSPCHPSFKSIPGGSLEFKCFS